MRKLYYLLAGFAFFSCTEEQIPEPGQTEPVFFAKGEAKTSAFRMEAGISDYYMYSSFENDKNDVYTFIGDLRPTDGSPASEELKIEIRANRISRPLSPVDVYEALASGLYEFREPEVSDKFAALKMDPIMQDPKFNYYWDFGDGNSSREMIPVHRYREPGYYKVTLELEDRGNNCSSKVSNTVDYFDYGINGWGNCHADFTFGIDLQNNVRVTTKNTSADMHYWDFGDGTTSIGPTATHSFSRVPGFHTIQHITYRASDSCYKENALTILVGAINHCPPNFNIERVNMASPDSLALSKVRVTWTDKAGTEYTSDQVVQKFDDNFEILSVEDYKDNESNESTVRVKYRFSCEVVSKESSQSLRLENVEGVFAFAYPTF